jgi:hypothetical protein
VDANEENDDHLPGVVPVIADDIEIPGVDVEVPKAQVDIDDLGIPRKKSAPIEVAAT